MPLVSRDGCPRAEADRAILALDRVRHVGDGVAFIVAETASRALDAAEAVSVDYEVLPAVMQPGASPAPVWPDAPDNVCFDWGVGDPETCDRLIAEAAHVVRLRLRIPRVVVNALEPRAAVGLYDPATAQYRLIATTQGVHFVRRVLAAAYGNLEDRLRVLTPNVGGGFGSKIYAYPEYALVLWAARLLGRPVRWCATRTEAFVSDTQGRDHDTEATLALDADGSFLAIRVQITVNLGAYLSQYSPFVATGCGAPVQAGGYRFRTTDIRVRGVFSNTTPIDAYRGAGRPEANYVVERLIDEAAFQLGCDRSALRARNLHRCANEPVTLATGLTVDGGRFLDNQVRCLDLTDLAGFSARRVASEAAGKLRGFGFANYVEANGGLGVAKLIDAAGVPVESAKIHFSADGSVTVAIGTQSTGQDHAGPLVDLVARNLGIEPTRITVTEGDTAALSVGGGTGGSKSLLTSSAAVAQMLHDVRAAAMALMAEAHGVSSRDINFDNGVLRLKDSNVAQLVTDLATLFPGRLDIQSSASISDGSFANGCHACEVEIDRETGDASVVAYNAVDDFGRVLHAGKVQGQIHGGVAQGIGQALFEACSYDCGSGQLISGSFLDYAVVHAGEMPPITWQDNGLPCTTNPLGVKACGEAGASAAPPAVMNAILDALRRCPGAERLQMPAGAGDIWALLAQWR
jgi:carbon-monoxide dehydrogenase large subunit